VKTKNVSAVSWNLVWKPMMIHGCVFSRLREDMHPESTMDHSKAAGSDGEHSRCDMREV
jgi:hypothetical protein